MKKIILTLLTCCYGLLMTAQTYHVGDLYTAPDGSQGIVYYILPDGSGGWVVALEDASTSCAWGEAEDVPGLYDTDFNSWPLLGDYDGYSNTQILRNFQNNNPEFAAGVVDFVNGWYLPSPQQLITLYARLSFVSPALIQAGGTDMANNYYWCSAERQNNRAWTVDFGSSGNNGSFSDQSKTAYYRVRAVRSFDYISDGISYQWSTGATTPKITVVPEQTTTYTVTVSVTGGTYADTVDHTIVVQGSLPSEFTIDTTEPYTWDGITYDKSGDYTRNYISVDGCDSIVTLHLTVTYIPNVVVTVTDDSICVGEEVALVAEVLNDSSFVINPELPAVMVGDILCTDGTTESPSAFAASGKTAMAVVFYVDNTGEHGWALHLQEEATTMAWSVNTTDVYNLYNRNNSRNAAYDMDGYSNTQVIRNYSTATYYPAAFAADFTNGWYLPAAGQLRILFNGILRVNASLQMVGGTQIPMNSAFSYWSSTENSQTSAWCVANDGCIRSNSKTYEQGVRCARDF